jgi:phosphoglycerate dehydrogenase-like enzyme
MAQVLITPHTAGETSRYEDNVVEILRDNWIAYGAARSNIATRSSDRRRKPAHRGRRTHDGTL